MELLTFLHCVSSEVASQQVSVAAGIGYCIPEEQQRGAPECMTGKDMDFCADNELCFVERAHSDRPWHLQGADGSSALLSLGGRSF